MTSSNEKENNKSYNEEESDNLSIKATWMYQSIPKKSKNSNSKNNNSFKILDSDNPRYKKNRTNEKMVIEDNEANISLNTSTKINKEKEDKNLDESKNINTTVFDDEISESNENEDNPYKPYFVINDFIQAQRPSLQEFICTICTGVFHKPVIDECGHIFCNDCIVKYRKTESIDCPLNKNKISSYLQFVKFIEDNIGRKELHCKNKKCIWIGKANTLEEHLKTTCNYQIIPCTCVDCSFKIYRKDLNTHLEKCDYKEISCKFCNCITKKNLLNDHLKECEKYPINCEKCDKLMIRKEMTSHLEKECPEVEVDCLYNKVGCLEKIMRKELQSHMSSKSDYHNSLFLDKMIDFDKNIEEKIEDCVDKCCKILIKKIFSNEKSLKSILNTDLMKKIIIESFDIDINTINQIKAISRKSNFNDIANKINDKQVNPIAINNNLNDLELRENKINSNTQNEMLNRKRDDSTTDLINSIKNRIRIGDSENNQNTNKERDNIVFLNSRLAYKSIPNNNTAISTQTKRIDPDLLNIEIDRRVSGPNISILSKLSARCYKETLHENFIFLNLNVATHRIKKWRVKIIKLVKWMAVGISDKSISVRNNFNFNVFDIQNPSKYLNGCFVIAQDGLIVNSNYLPENNIRVREASFNQGSVIEMTFDIIKETLEFHYLQTNYKITLHNITVEPQSVLLPIVVVKSAGDEIEFEPDF